MDVFWVWTANCLFSVWFLRWWYCLFNFNAYSTLYMESESYLCLNIITFFHFQVGILLPLANVRGLQSMFTGNAWIIGVLWRLGFTHLIFCNIWPVCFLWFVHSVLQCDSNIYFIYWIMANHNCGVSFPVGYIQLKIHISIVNKY